MKFSKIIVSISKFQLAIGLKSIDAGLKQNKKGFKRNVRDRISKLGYKIETAIIK